MNREDDKRRIHVWLRNQAGNEFIDKAGWHDVHFAHVFRGLWQHNGTYQREVTSETGIFQQKTGLVDHIGELVEAGEEWIFRLVTMKNYPNHEKAVLEEYLYQQLQFDENNQYGNKTFRPRHREKPIAREVLRREDK